MQAFNMLDLPVIAIVASGKVELVEEGINGTLVQPGNVGEMAQALLGYLDAPARIAEQRFSIPAMAEALCGGIR